MVASIGLVVVRILIFKPLLLSYFISDSDQVCGRLHGLIRACKSGSHADMVAVPFKKEINMECTQYFILCDDNAMIS